MTVQAAGLAGYIREYMEEFVDPPAPEDQVEGPDWHDPGPDDPDGDIEARVWTAMTVAMDSELQYLSGRGLVRVIEAAQLVISRLQAMQEQAIAELAVPGRAGDPTGLAMQVAELKRFGESAGPDEYDVEVAAHRLAGAQVAAALGVSPMTGSNRVADAVDLVRTCPRVWQALADGVIDRYRAKLICARTMVLDQDVRAVVIGKALSRSAGLTAGQLDRWLQTAVIAADPDAARTRREEAVAKRRLTTSAFEDGMGQFAAILPVDRVTAAWDLFDLVGRGLKDTVEGDRRGIDALRADGFSDLVELLLAGDTVSLAGVLARGARLPDTNTHDGGCPGGRPAGADTDGCWTNELPPPVECPGGHAAGADTDGGVPAGEGTPAGEIGIGDPSVASSTTPSTPTATPDPRSPVPGAGQTAGPVEESTDGHGGACLPERRAALPTRQGRPVQLNLTMPLSTLARITQDPAWINSYGAIDADYARLIADAATSVSLLVTDDQGHPVGASERRYRPRQTVRDKVTTINPHCVFLGCGAPAVICDLDHLDPFDRDHPERGGLTNERNLAPVCRGHHNLHTHGGWRYHHNPDGSWTFTSPLGLIYRRPAPQTPATTTILTDPPENPPY